jgi:hypothetical protein
MQMASFGRNSAKIEGLQMKFGHIDQAPTMYHFFRVIWVSITETKSEKWVFSFFLPCIFVHTSHKIQAKISFFAYSKQSFFWVIDQNGQVKAC